MSSIYRLKPAFQTLLSPLLGALERSAVSPNQITLATMLMSLAYGAALACYPQQAGLWYGLPALLLLRMALNAIDGMLANRTGQKTHLGALLNEMGDQVSDLALYLPFALVAAVPAPLLVMVLFAAMLAEFAGVLGPGIGAPRGFQGPMGKSDRAFAFSVLALWIAIGTGSAGVSAALTWALLLLLVLSMWTVFNRLRHALRACAPATP